jgi:hypothetical protein
MCSRAPPPTGGLFLGPKDSTAPCKWVTEGTPNSIREGWGQEGKSQAPFPLKCHTMTPAEHMSSRKVKVSSDGGTSVPELSTLSNSLYNAIRPVTPDLIDREHENPTIFTVWYLSLPWTCCQDMVLPTVNYVTQSNSTACKSKAALQRA